MNSLEDRIALLEKSRATHRLLSVAALTFSGLVVLLGAMRSEPAVISVEEVRTERLVIGAPGEHPRGVFEVRGDFAAFEMFGADDVERVSIGSTSGDPSATSLTLFDKTGRSRFEALSEPGSLELRMNTWEPTSYKEVERLEKEGDRSSLMLSCRPWFTGLHAGGGSSMNTGFGVRAEENERYGLMYLNHSRRLDLKQEDMSQAWGGGSYFSVSPWARVGLKEEHIQRR